MNNKVTVGISAYNEQYTIADVLLQVLEQEQKDWELEEILVYCDGCTDDTVAMVKSIKSPLIKLVDNRERMGKTHRLNQIFQASQGDILVLFDADITLKDKSVISKLIQPLVNSKHEARVHLVGGNSQPHTPKTWFEKAVYSSFEVFYASRKKLKGGHNVFGCTGSIMAMRNSFAKELRLPKIINEDAFVYLTCIQKGYNFRYVDDAVIYYHVPKKSADYFKQVLRSEPAAVNVDLESYFPGLVDSELKRPLTHYAQEVLKVLLRNPLGVSFIIALNLLAKPFFRIVKANYRLGWFTAHSTKYASKNKLTLAERLLSTGLSLISLINQKGPTPPYILCYHSVSNDGWRYSTPEKEFESQMKFLKQTKKLVSLTEILENPRPNTVAITFDDGYVDNLTFVAPLLKKLSIPATLFVLGEAEHADRHELDNNKALLKIDQVRKLKSLGWEIGHHTRTHADLMSLSEAQLKQEILVDKKKLEGKLGFDLKYFAFPRGAYSQKINRIVDSAGYRAVFTVDGGKMARNDTTGLYNRVPMEEIIEGKRFRAQVTSMGLSFQKIYMQLLKWKAYGFMHK